VDGGSDELGFFGGSHWSGLNVLQGCHVCEIVSIALNSIAVMGGPTLLLVNQEMDVRVNGDDDHVREDVDGANDVQGIGIIERDSLGHLHHSEDDDQVGTIDHVRIRSFQCLEGVIRTFED
jgi:hypothetical protein